MKEIKIEMLSTGDEVLYGQIIDTNAAWLSDLFFHEGFLITTRFTVGDNLKQLVETLQQRSEKNDILIVNGGLGPTSDDMSAEAAAIANHEVLELKNDWLIEMERYFASRSREMSSANRKQAMLPKSAVIVNNPIGTACGFKMHFNQCTIFFTPGVPSEFKEMVQTEILPYIKKHYPDVNKPLCYRLTTMGCSESDLATEIDSKIVIPEGVAIGYRAAMPIIELKLTGYQHQKDIMDALWIQLKAIVKDNILYEGTITSQNEVGLAKIVAGLLHKNNFSIAVLEQQSAGVIGYQLFESDAPIVKSEVMPLLINDPKDYLIDLLNKTKANIALGLVNFKEQNSLFTLLIATKQQILSFNLKYKSRKYNRKNEQQIFSAIALDAVRRYLLDMPIIGPNIWLEVIE